MKKIIIAISCFIFPSKIAVFILRLFKNDVSYHTRIGFSIILIQSLTTKGKTSIGHFNYITCDNIDLKNTAFIGHLNILRGPFDITIDELSSIGNSNKIMRAPLGITTGRSELVLGYMSKITADHRLDLTKSIILGNYTTIAGSGSQMWTHGYYHYPEGPGRYRIDGEIIIENNVYVGSHVVINAGVRIAKAVIVGSQTCVSKSLYEPGMYVSQALRHIPTDVENARSRFVLDISNTNEIVYLKNPA